MQFGARQLGDFIELVFTFADAARPQELCELDMYCVSLHHTPFAVHRGENDVMDTMDVTAQTMVLYISPICSE